MSPLAAKIGNKHQLERFQKDCGELEGVNRYVHAFLK
jgi:hypothetical protein